MLLWPHLHWQPNPASIRSLPHPHWNLVDLNGRMFKPIELQSGCGIDLIQAGFGCQCKWGLRHLNV